MKFNTYNFPILNEFFANPDGTFIFRRNFNNTVNDIFKIKFNYTEDFNTWTSDVVASITGFHDSLDDNSVVFPRGRMDMIE